MVLECRIRLLRRYCYSFCLFCCCCCGCYFIGGSFFQEVHAAAAATAAAVIESILQPSNRGQQQQQVCLLLEILHNKGVKKCFLSQWSWRGERKTKDPQCKQKKVEREGQSSSSKVQNLSIMFYGHKTPWKNEWDLRLKQRYKFLIRQKTFFLSPFSPSPFSLLCHRPITFLVWKHFLHVSYLLWSLIQQGEKYALSPEL